MPNSDFFVRVSVADMISVGVFERFPKLQVEAVEQQLGWVPFFLERMDYAYNQRGSGRQRYRFKEDMLPSDFFHRNVFLGFQEDELGIRLRDMIGVDSLQWGSNYPHMESTFQEPADPGGGSGRLHRRRESEDRRRQCGQSI